MTLAQLIATLPTDLVKSITWDRGTEMAEHASSDLTGVTQTECDDVAPRLSTRPRMTLNWQTAGQVLNGALVATAG